MNKVTNYRKNKEGMSLLEIILAIAVFSVGVLSVAYLFIGSYTASVYNLEKNQATLLAKEGVEAVRSICNDSFGNLSPLTAGGIEIVEGKWSLKVTPDEIGGKFTRSINIEEVTAEEEFKVTVAVSWQPQRGEESEVSLVEHLTIWREPLYFLNASSTAGGSVISPAQQETGHNYGDVVSIEAGAAEGYSFAEWTGDTLTIANPLSASTTITIEGGYSIVANFTEIEGGE